MLLLFKLAVTPILIAVISLAARWWGPTVGALLMGLPWMTGPVLFFLVMDRGADFGVSASIGVELGIVCLCSFLLAFGWVTAIASWPACLMAAAAAFAGTAWATQGLAISLPESAALAAMCLILVYLLLPRAAAKALPAALPWWDIPCRMVVALVLVGGITLSADMLGPQLSGIVSTYPAIVTVIAAFTYHQWGRDAVRQVLRGLTLSLLAFVAFFLALGLTLPDVGLVMSFVLGTAAALPISGAVLVYDRWMARR
jgi:hypothetical protein